MIFWKYLGETSGESAASESSGEGDIGLGLAIGHHCVKRMAELAGGVREREREYKTTSVFCCVREMRETIGLFIERERERERVRVVWGNGDLSLSLCLCCSLFSSFFIFLLRQLLFSSPLV